MKPPWIVILDLAVIFALLLSIKWISFSEQIWPPPASLVPDNSRALIVEDSIQLKPWLSQKYLTHPTRGY